VTLGYRGDTLNFIERFLGISPDNGTGSAEIILVALIVVIIAAIAWRLIALSKRNQ